MALTKISTAMWNSVPHHDTHDFNVDDVLYVDVSANRVGIGTASPSTKLHVEGSSIIANSTAINPDSYTNKVVAGAIAQASNWGLTSAIGGNGGPGDSWAIGTNGSYLYMGYGDQANTNSLQTFLQVLGRNVSLVPDNGNVGIGTTSPDIYGFGGKLLTISGAGTYTNLIIAGDTNSGISFGTTSGRLGQITMDSSAGLSIATQGTGAGTSMVIDRSGNVGIGATNPTSKLSIEGSNSGSVPLVNLVASGTGAFQRGVRLLNSGMNAGDHLMYAVGQADGTKNMGQFYFYYAGAGSNSNRISMGLHSVDDVFNILGTGKVGIGTTSPSATFQVKPSTGAGQGGAIALSREGNRSTLQAYYVINSDSYGDELYMGVGANSSDVSIGARHGSISFQTGAYAERLNINTSGNVTANVDMRAPIFYDSNDTNYYVDPNSTSKFETINILDSASTHGVLHTSDPYHGLTMRGYPNTANTTAMTAGDYMSFWEYGGIFRFYKKQPSVLTLQAWIDNGSINAITDARAPIFYDSDNTGYYVDPTSYSQLNNGNFNSAPNGRTLSLGSDDISRVYNDATRSSLVINATYYPHLYINATTANNDQHGAVISMTGTLTAGGYRRWGMGIPNRNPVALSWGYYDNQTNPHYGVGGNIGYTATGAKMWLDTSGNLATVGSMRSPIFYDYDDTSYYLNPNSSGSLLRGRINVRGEHYTTSIRLFLDGSDNAAGTGSINLQAWCSEPGNTWDGAGFGYNVDNNTNESGNVPAYYFGRHNPSLGQAYMRMLSNGTWLFYNTASGSNTRYTTMELSNTGHLIANNSARAPIFYDSNDTNYYADLTSGADSIRAAGDIVAYYSSDRRLKDNIIKIDSALDKINAIGGYTFEWNEESHKQTGSKDVGVIAQEVEEIFPEIVQTRSNGYKAVNYEKLVPLLIEAVKELSEKVKILENK